ncbi:HlyC/CorC family transporter [Rhodoplanes sp. Z2-YC6860]|uniref:HlyC/CorC family transporter n=1 Tax=Rhodoplanes sp. Z2-YC6860 TaxID=674703 RepID=UPI00078C1DAF|nr:HlyC/CorC family transporter [Rhodoplanes sp. Z2-YC6860]AMN39210.1 Mg2+ and Co2+ transporter CorB [Rhodoplanes sp. Z2-YC6860]
MSGDNWISLLIVLGSLLLSAFFSAGETSLTAASRARLTRMQNQGNKRAGIVLRLLESRERMIGALLLGNNVANIGASALTTSVLLAIFGDVGVLYATVVMSIVVIVFAEVLPKTAAISAPERIALVVARPVAFVVKILGPLLAAIERLVKLILRPFGIRVGEDQSMLAPHEEIRGTVDLLHREGGVEKHDRDMMGGLLDLNELTVADVMVHRTEMATIDAGQPSEEIVAEALKSEYTRIPLWRNTPENIIGILHAKDLLRAIQSAEGDVSQIDIMAIALPPWFVPDIRPLSEQLKAFRRRKTHFALVVDEYGEVEGLVTLEDILEEIVGDISDEHDIPVPGLRPQPDGSVNVDGAVPIRDLNRAMEWNLPDAEATTIAGLVIHEARSIPDVGQSFTFHGFRFSVLRKQRNRITALRIMPLVRKPLALARAG